MLAFCLIVFCLLLSSSQRSSHDVLTLASWLQSRKDPFFNSFSEQSLVDIARNIEFRSFPPHFVGLLAHPLCFPLLDLFLLIKIRGVNCFFSFPVAPTPLQPLAPAPPRHQGRQEEDDDDEEAPEGLEEGDGDEDEEEELEEVTCIHHHEGGKAGDQGEEKEEEPRRSSSSFSSSSSGFSTSSSDLSFSSSVRSFSSFLASSSGFSSLSASASPSSSSFAQPPPSPLSLPPVVTFLVDSEEEADVDEK